MTTEEIETAIVEKLKQNIDIQDSDVLGFPDSPQNYFPKHPVGEVLVQYASSGFAEPRALNSITQARNLRFSIFVLRRNLRDHSGVYGALDAVRDSLTGFSIPGTSKMYQISEKFIAEQSGIWTYQMIFAIRTTYEEKQ